MMNCRVKDEAAPLEPPQRVTHSYTPKEYHPGQTGRTWAHGHSPKKSVRERNDVSRYSSRVVLFASCSATFFLFLALHLFIFFWSVRKKNRTPERWGTWRTVQRARERDARLAASENGIFHVKCESLVDTLKEKRNLFLFIISEKKLFFILLSLFFLFILTPSPIQLMVLVSLLLFS